MPMRFHTYLSLPSADGWDSGTANNTIQRIERNLWDTEDALDEWRDHAHNLEARNQELLDWGNAAVNRINDDLLPRLARLQAREKELAGALERMRQAGAELTDNVRKSQALLEKRKAELLGWGKGLQAHIDGKLLPRIKALEAREHELVAKVNAHAKRINEDFIPEVGKFLAGQKQAAEEAARAAEREKSLEARNAALAEENERLRADLAAARHDLADADEAGHALRDEVDSLERDAHERQALSS